MPDKEKEESLEEPLYDFLKDKYVYPGDPNYERLKAIQQIFYSDSDKEK